MLAGILRLVLVFVDEWRLRAEVLLDGRERPKRSDIERLIRNFSALGDAGRSEDPEWNQGLVTRLRELATA